MANEVKILNYTIEHDNIDINIIDCYYALTFKDLHNDYKVYLCYTNIDNELFIYDNGLRTKIAVLIKDTDKSGKYQYYSEYGEIDSVINLKKLIVTYNKIKEKYTKDDIKELLETYKKDYIEFNEKEIVKKLELK